MSVSALDFSKSGVLSGDAAESSEVVLRNAASRLYYGFFHAAGSYACVLDENYGSYGGRTHERLIHFFKNRPAFVNGKQNLTHRQISIWLRQARQARCLADYEIEYHFVKADYDAQLKLCEESLSRIQELHP